MPPGTLPQAMLDALFRRPVAQLLVFPAHLKSRLDSLLLLAYATPPQNLDEIAQSGRSLADRLSIAAANIAREQMLYDQAHFDALTQLPNRLLLRDRTEQAIVHADRTETSVALLFIDLDGFKHVNDSLGHTRGDILLVEYGERLRRRMRQGDTVARMGGDEFVVLIPDLARDTAYATVDRIARALNEALAEPFQLGEQHLVSPASIGIALYPDNASSHEELLKMADAAMYESKRRAPGGYCFFTSNISEHSAGGDDGMDALRMSSITYRIATGAQAGRKVITLQTLPGDDGSLEGDAGKVGGFSLHAGVAAEAHESQKLERLCRYIARPAVSEKRLSISSQGRVRYELKTPWRNGTTHVEWDSVDFIAKLAALVPPPRAHLTRFHGVFAPNAALRAQLTPSGRGKRPATDAARVEVSASDTPRSPEEKRRAMSWAQRLKRVFGIDVSTCVHCGGAVRIVASIEEPEAIRAILAHFAKHGALEEAHYRPRPRGPPAVVMAA
jgi:diguanylate cyclase (GGDEF)-like protein